MDRGIKVEFSNLAEALPRSRIETFELVNCSTTAANLLLLLPESSKRTALKEIILRDVDIGTGGDWLSVQKAFRRKHKACSLVLHDCHDYIETSSS